MEEQAQGTPSDILDLTTQTGLAKVPGWEEPVPISEIVAKPALTQMRQRDRAELERAFAEAQAQYAPVIELQQEMETDPVGFYQRVRAAAVEAGMDLATLEGSPAPRPSASQGATVPDDALSELRTQIALLAQQNADLQQTVTRRMAQETIDRETAAITAADPELAKDRQRLLAIYKAAQEEGVPIPKARAIAEFDRLQAEVKRLRDENDNLRLLRQYPSLATGDERLVGDAAGKGKKAPTLMEAFMNRRKTLLES